MSGALRKLPGIGTIDVEAGNRNVTVAYDDKQVKVEQMLDVLKAVKRPAKVKS